jgi:hypothetical protein
VKKRRWGAKRAKTTAESLKAEAEMVYDAAKNKGRIVPDPHLYFVLSLSDSLRTPLIHQVLKNLEVDVVESITDQVVKVRLNKENYQTFLRGLEKNSAYVQSVSETRLETKIDKQLLAMIDSEPEKRLRVNIEFTRVREESLTVISQSISEYVTSRGLGKVEEAYVGDRFFVLSAEIPAKFIREMALDSDAINRINLASVIKLDNTGFFLSSLDQEKRPVMKPRSLSLTPTVRETGPLPIVCVIDSGINKEHDLVKPFLVQKYDVASGSANPCDDVICHGTMVAGMSIYEGNVLSGQPSAQVIAVRLFQESEYSGNLIPSLRNIVRMFKTTTRVFNLSFGSLVPDPISSRALDDLAFKEKVLFAAAAGNILPAQIIAELRQGTAYPQFLTNYPIYFPGDCFNVVTVGSFAEKASNIVQRERPSPFTRTYPSPTKVKPELLASGGNLNLETEGDDIKGLSYVGCGIFSASNTDNDVKEDVGTSYSCPIVSSILASLIQKFPEHSPCLYKALVGSSCQQLTDDSGSFFDKSIQGFGVPSRIYALHSTFWRVNLCADSTFDLGASRQIHRYKFLFPDNADRIRVTVCFDVEPLLGSELPYRIIHRLHKPGTQFKTSARPDTEIRGTESNIEQFEYQVKRAGRGWWTLDVYPRPKQAVLPEWMTGRVVYYSVVITLISSSQRDIYTTVSRQMRRTVVLQKPLAQAVAPVLPAVAR